MMIEELKARAALRRERTPDRSEEDPLLSDLVAAEADLDAAITLAEELLKWAQEAEYEMAEEGIGPLLPERFGGQRARDWRLSREAQQTDEGTT